MSLGLTRRVFGVLTLLGSALLLIGLFLPWIIKIDYLPHAGCPSDSKCPAPTTINSSFWQVFLGSVNLASPNWWLTVAIGPGFLLLLILLQGMIALSALRARGARVLFVVGILTALMALIFNLLTAWIDYCLFFCSPGFVPPGVFHTAPGLFGGVGIRFLASGFWLLLSGFFVIIGSNLVLLVAYF